MDLSTARVTGYGVRARLPKDDLGALIMPMVRFKFHEGFVSMSKSSDGRWILCVWVDGAGRIKPVRSLEAAAALGVRLGRAVAEELLRRNAQYHVGTPTA